MTGINLDDRFHKYLLSIPDNEDVDQLDELFRKEDGTQSKKPDYFIANRSIVLEKKVLKSDPQKKAYKFLDAQVQSDDELRLCFSTSRTLNEVFSKYSKGTSLKNKLLDKMYKGFRNDVIKGANKQLKLSMQHLEDKHALKGLLILNQDVNSLSHDLLLTEIQINLLRESETDSIDFVLLISETANDLSAGVCPYSVIYSNRCDNIDYLKVIIERSMMLGWAAYNQRPVML